MKTIQQRVEEACDENGSVEMRSYSGRGMMGKECLAIVGDIKELYDIIHMVIVNQADETVSAALDCEDDESEMVAVSDMGQSLADNVRELITGFRVDSMGIDHVMYWPKIKFEGKDDEPSDD